MSNLSRKLMMGAAGAAGEKVYVEDVFSTYLYTGNGSTQTITNGIDLAGEGGLVWLKQRTGAGLQHVLYDTARGSASALFTSLTNEAVTSGGTYTATFNATGFQTNISGGNVNNSSQPNASWTFRKAAKFFDVVTWTGDGAASRAIAHNLGSQPGFIVCKRTDSTSMWPCAHRGNGTTGIYGMTLNSTGEGYSWSQYNTYITSTTFDPTQLSGGFNTNGATYVAYLFAHDAGGFGDSGNESVVKCGSFSSGGEVTLGWEPQFLLVKQANSARDWYVIDTMRGFSRTSGIVLSPNLSNAETDEFGSFMPPTATGFINNYFGSGTYIYIAIRRGPMKTPTVGTEVFSAVVRNGTGAAATVTGVGFAPELVFAKNRAQPLTAVFYDKLRGVGRVLASSSTDAEVIEATSDGITSFNNDGISLREDNDQYGGINNSIGTSYANYLFRRAPGFFDVVAYTGDGSFGTQNHNLGVRPDLIITKARSSSSNWVVQYVTSFSTCKLLYLNSSNASYADGSGYTFNSTVYGEEFAANGVTYISYLFASCPGVSKVGSYTGTGTTLSIDCGFTAGARLVLIKRTDSTGSWYVWDTARGIISGNDPYLLLNSTAAEVTNTDYIDPYSAGFEISSTAPAEINASGGSYIFLAVA